MLKRAERLQRSGFTAVSRMRAVHESLFTMRALPQKESQPDDRKFSVVVSKKAAKTAVARNALRRKVYAALAESGVGGLHAIFYMKPEAVQASYADIRAAIARAFTAR